MVDSNQFVTDLTTIGGGTAHMIGYAQNAGAAYIEAPNNTQQADGVVPLDRLPAQWWNWFLNQATRRFSEYETYVENIVAELDGVLDILGITPDAGDPSTVNQLKTMFASHYLQDYLPEVIAAASSFSADATHENHILVADDDGNSGFSVKKVPYAPGFILNTQLGSAAKTLTLPSNCPFDGQTMKICFANGHKAGNSTDYMTLNVNSTGPVPIVSNQNGTLANLPIHELTAGTYSVLMANVTLEMYYTSNGFNSNPAWVVIGNPVVLSSTDYTIYADGYNLYESKDISIGSYDSGIGIGTGFTFKCKWFPNQKKLFFTEFELMKTGAFAEQGVTLNLSQDIKDLIDNSNAGIFGVCFARNTLNGDFSWGVYTMISSGRISFSTPSGFDEVRCNGLTLFLG